MPNGYMWWLMSTASKTYCMTLDFNIFWSRSPELKQYKPRYSLVKVILLHDHFLPGHRRPVLDE